MEKRNVSFVPSIISHLIIKIVQLRERAPYHAVTKQKKLTVKKSIHEIPQNIP